VASASQGDKKSVIDEVVEKLVLLIRYSPGSILWKKFSI